MGKKKGAKYEQIIEAAVTVIAKYGYHQAQVAKIAKEAGVADGTIYLYFTSKEDLLISLFEEKMGQFIETIRTRIQTKETFEEKLLLLIQTHFEQLQANPQLAVVTQLELRQSNKELRKKINQILKGYLLLIDELIKEGQSSASMEQQLDSRLVRQMIFGTLDEVVTNWVMKECKYDLVVQAKPIQQMLVRGISQRLS
ncbi:TetR family transcriptional regulator [Alkalihalobacillus oceani]|uniref:TetR/AcrR family transcriptional regulator n=1 Tax=Halalkalibacter oceani TaxID=1653776 RepID=UPI00203CA927|nr:TetR family transcriptional regulator [Halalkalibacter oceani]